MYRILGTALLLRNYCSTPDHPKEASLPLANSLLFLEIQISIDFSFEPKLLASAKARLLSPYRLNPFNEILLGQPPQIPNDTLF